MLWIASLVLAALATWRIRREGRQLSNAIVLTLALLAAAVALADLLFDSISVDDRLVVLIAAGLASAVAVVLTSAYFTVCGAIAIRKEGWGRSYVFTMVVGLLMIGYSVPGMFALLGGERPFRLLLLALLPGVLYLSLVFTAFISYGSLYGRHTRQCGDRAAFVIVLGAGLIGGRVTPLLASRLDVGLGIWQRSKAQGGHPALVVSGGQGQHTTRTEAEAMAEYLAIRGVPEQELLLEEQSHTTEQNLRFSQQLLREVGCHGAGAVVTNSFHAFRAALLMRKVGLDGQVVGSSTAQYFWPSAIIREFVAILRDHLWLNLIVGAVCSIPVVWWLLTTVGGRL